MNLIEEQIILYKLDGNQARRYALLQRLVEFASEKTGLTPVQLNGIISLLYNKYVVRTHRNKNVRLEMIHEFFALLTKFIDTKTAFNLLKNFTRTSRAKSCLKKFNEYRRLYKLNDVNARVKRVLDVIKKHWEELVMIMKIYEIDIIRFRKCVNQTVPVLLRGWIGGDKTVAATAALKCLRDLGLRKNTVSIFRVFDVEGYRAEISRLLQKLS